MVVRIQYEYGTFDMVKATRLDDLLPQGKIKAFQRSDGWAIVGKDAIRGIRQEYTGPERRSQRARVAA